MFKIEDVPPPQQEGQQQEEEGQESVFKNVVSYEYKNAYQKYFGNDESDIRVIKAIHSLDEMKSFIGERKEIIKTSYSSRVQPLEEDKLWELVSEDVEREIVLRFTKLFMQVDESRPTEAWEKASTEGGLYDNPHVVLANMKSAIQELGRMTQRMTNEQRIEKFGSMKFFRRFSDEPGMSLRLSLMR